jgi:hypothetical protein
MMRYLAGCRCWRCRRGNRLYKDKLANNVMLFGPNDLVPTDRVRSFLLDMQKLGIGYKTVAKQVGLGKTSLGRLVWGGHEGRKLFMRRRKEAQVLSYRPTLDTVPRNLNIDPADTLNKLRWLIAWGYPASLISHEALGNRSGGLQIRSLRGKPMPVIARTAIRVRDFFAGIEALRAVWQARRGPIPRHQYVYWKDGTTGCTVRQMELRPFAKAHDYHYRYSPELKEAIRLANQLKHTYREKAKNEKHNRRSA